MELVDKIKKLAKDVGYIDCGISSPKPFEKYLTELQKRMRMYPEAAHLYDGLRQRAFPLQNKPWGKSIVSCVHWYGKYKIPDMISSGIGRNYLFDRRYKGNPDNHLPRKMKKALKSLGLRVQNAGVPERWAGVRAGVCCFGKNNFVYREKEGSWINIESFIVDAELPPDEPNYKPLCPDSCSICVQKCPSSALKKPFCMRMDECVAYLTYQAEEPISDGLWEMMGQWVYGCDECQLVCPLNRGKWQPIQHAQWLEEAADCLTNKALAGMDQETYEDIVHPLFWYIPEGNVERWKRNAKRALSCTTG